MKFDELAQCELRKRFVPIPAGGIALRRRFVGHSKTTTTSLISPENI